MHAVYPWTLAIGLLIALFGLILLANGVTGTGIAVASLGGGMVVGSLFARASHVRRQQHEELMAELRRQRGEDGVDAS